MSQPDPLHPRLLLHGTLSTSIFSLSQASPSSAPLTFTSPPASLTHPPNHSPHQLCSIPSLQSSYSSYFSLTSTITGSKPQQMRLHGMIAPRVTIRDPHAELITFWPEKDDATVITSDKAYHPDDDTNVDLNGTNLDNNSPDKNNINCNNNGNNNSNNNSNNSTFCIPLGPHPSSRRPERAAESDTTTSLLPYLAIAGTPLAVLVVGVTYEIGLRNVRGLYPGHVWWWGVREEEGGVGVAGGKGGRVFELPVADLEGGSGGGAKPLGVEMVGKPILRIVD